MTIHNFEKSNAFAGQHELYAERLYRKMFPGDCEIIRDRARQRAGADVRINSNGRVIHIEEKIRKKKYPDFFLEYFSAKEYDTPGWIEKDLLCDYLSYICTEDGCVDILPFALLRHAWKRKGNEWKTVYGEVHVHNYGPNTRYTTVGVCVPKQIVWSEISRPFQKIGAP